MLTTKQAAAILKVSPARVRQFIMEGRLKATKLTPRMSVITEADFEAFRTTPPPPRGRRPRKQNDQP